MVTPDTLMQIFTLVTGVVYIVLEIRQKNLMWAVGVLTAAAAMWVFFREGLYASFGLNAYYFFMSFWGLWQWRKTKKSVKEKSGADSAASGDLICLNRIGLPVLAISAAAAVLGTALLSVVMEKFENPMSFMDSSVAVLSAVATWWLGRSYLEQWYIWIAADFVCAVLCACQGLWWMAALYLFYTVAAAYGLVHWKRHGKYADAL
ncbi:MAG: nicotinamide riboside transporter PnuC [Bacteroidales bacterium]|nr:nicotinamide riboside transporter PnuC [Bacteroidales bacterium]